VYSENYYAARKRKVEKNLDTKESISLNDANNYIFRFSKLGWINCDRFYGEKKKLLIVETEPEATVYCVFQRINSLMKATGVIESKKIKGIPEKYPITLFALYEKEGQSYIALEEAVNDGEVKSLKAFKKVTVEELKETLKKI